MPNIAVGDRASLKQSYDSNHVYGPQPNYIRKPSSSFEVLSSKTKPNQSSNTNGRRYAGGTSFLTRNNYSFCGSGSSKFAVPSPPKHSLTFSSSEAAADVVRPALRDHTARGTRAHVVAGDSQKTSTVRNKYQSASIVARPSSRDRPSSLETTQNSIDFSHSTKSSPTLPRVLPSLPSRHSPVYRRASHTKEEISIDDPPYTSGYEPSFSRSNTPKRFSDHREAERIDSSVHDGNGTIGLKNIGNTCFMNSILQCLSHTIQLRDYCLRSDYEREINTSSPMKGKLMKAFAEVIKELWSGRSYAVTPSNFKTQIQRFSPRFVGYEQQDSQEFLRFLLEGLHEDINQVRRKSSEPLKDLSKLRSQDIARETWKWYEKKDKSFVFDLFVGQLESHLQCVECGHISLTYDPFWDLSLPISKSSYSSEATSLDECLRTFTKEEMLDRDEKPMCEKCKVRRKMAKRLSIHRFPSILVIHLKRFHEGSRYRQKLSNLVSFPVSEPLKLSQFASSTCEDKSTTTYDLYAVSNHCGSCYGGHYTAHCFNFDMDRWHEFNDSRVSNINERSVCTKEAYVLFYVQRSSSRGRISRL